MRLVLCLILFATFVVMPAHAADRPLAGNHTSDRAEIHKVVEQFEAALIARDGHTLAGLFLQDHDSWVSVADAAKWAKLRALNLQARKVLPSSWRKFSKFIHDAKVPVEERFYNVRIDTNGAVAAVWFDFDFLVDGKVVNRGSESWQMVRAEYGWKISSMLYSMGD